MNNQDNKKVFKKSNINWLITIQSRPNKNRGVDNGRIKRMEYENYKM